METSILLALQSVRLEGLVQFLALVSAIGNFALVWFFLALILLLFKQYRFLGILIIISTLSCLIVGSLILSNIIARPRPFNELMGVTAFIGVSSAGYSMPSFHASSSIAACTLLIFYSTKKISIPFSILGLLICFSRLYLGVSYPTDILAGMVLGVAISIIEILIFRLISQRIKPIEPKHLQEKTNKRKTIKR